MKRELLCLLLTGVPAIPARAETLAGPVSAAVERVVDGDTIAVRARIWLGQDIHVLVRVRGIDAPELRARCAEEKRLAQIAARHVAEAVSEGMVTLSHIEGDKYHGRVLADVLLTNGRDLAGLMLASGSARPYAGAARQPWCVG